MKEIGKKTLSLITIILMVFSIAFNLLSEGSKVLADSVGGVSFTFYNGTGSSSTAVSPDSNGVYKFDSTGRVKFDDDNYELAKNKNNSYEDIPLTITESVNNNYIITSTESASGVYTLYIYIKGTNRQKGTITVKPNANKGYKIYYRALKTDGDFVSAHINTGDTISVVSDVALWITGTSDPIDVNGTKYESNSSLIDSGSYNIKFGSNGRYTVKIDDDNKFYIDYTGGETVGIVTNYTGTSYSGESGTIIKTDRASGSTVGTMGGTANWIIKDDSGTEYFCYRHGYNLNFQGKYYYKLKSWTGHNVSVKDKDKLILAFIKEVTTEEAAEIAGVNPSVFTADWKSHFMQYYIWNNLKYDSGSPSASYGSTLQKLLEKLEAPDSEYINVGEMTFSTGERNFKFNSIEIKAYYLAGKYYSSTGNLAWAQNEANTKEYQPFITVDTSSTPTEGPQKTHISIEKVDDDGPVTEGVKLKVVKYKGNNPTGTVVVEDYINSEGKIENIQLERNQTYTIWESEVPDNYEISKQYVYFQTDGKGNIKQNTLKIKTATYTDKGYVRTKNDSQDKEVTGTTKKDWSYEIADGKMVFTLKNTKKGEGYIKIEKVKESKNLINDEEIGFTLEKIERGKIANTEEFKTQNGKLEIPISANSEYKLYESKTNTEKYIPTTEFLYFKTDINFNVISKYIRQGSRNQDTGYIDQSPLNATIVSDSKLWLEQAPSGNIKIYYKVVNKEKEEGDVLKLKINKLDSETKTEVPGTAIFAVQNGEETLGQITVKNGKTNEELTILRNLKPGEYNFVIVESTTPNGYTRIQDQVELKVKINSSGEITYLNPSNNQWVKVEDDRIIALDIENSPVATDKIKLNLVKIDGQTGAKIPGATFNISGDANGTIAGNETINLLEDIEKGKSYKITITETKEPEGYQKIEESILLEFKVKKNGIVERPCLSQRPSGVKLKTKVSEENGQNILEITIEVKNYKDVPEQIEVPLLMNIEGDVWLDNPTGKSGEVNGIYDAGTDKLLEGVIVQLCDENGTPVTDIAKSQDIYKAIDNIKEAQEKQKAANKSYISNFTDGAENLAKLQPKHTEAAEKIINGINKNSAEVHYEVNKLNELEYYPMGSTTKPSGAPLSMDEFLNDILGPIRKNNKILDGGHSGLGKSIPGITNTIGKRLSDIGISQFTYNADASFWNLEEGELTPYSGVVLMSRKDHPDSTMDDSRRS